MIEFYRDPVTQTIPEFERAYIAHRQDRRTLYAEAGNLNVILARCWFGIRPLTPALIKRAIGLAIQAVDYYQRAGLGFRAETVSRYVRLLRHEYQRLEAEEGFR